MTNTGIIAGTVLRIEKTSIHDGPGLRTVVFLKDCPLKCRWCSTPEAQSSSIEFGYGLIMTVGEVMKEISKDEIFYFHSGGGVTISGGEPLIQADFATEILKESKRRAINTALETSMFGDFSELSKLLPYLDTLYADIKHINTNAHRQFTGVGNELILDNIRAAADSFDGEIRIRIPLVPTFNMTSENAEGIGKFCSDLGKVCEIELLPYHRLGVDTYRILGKEYSFSDIKTPELGELEAFADVVRENAKGVTVNYQYLGGHDT